MVPSKLQTKGKEKETLMDLLLGKCPEGHLAFWRFCQTSRLGDLRECGGLLVTVLLSFQVA